MAFENSRKRAREARQKDFSKLPEDAPVVEHEVTESKAHTEIREKLVAMTESAAMTDAVLARICAVYLSMVDGIISGEIHPEATLSISALGEGHVLLEEVISKGQKVEARPAVRGRLTEIASFDEEGVSWNGDAVFREQIITDWYERRHGQIFKRD